MRGAEGAEAKVPQGQQETGGQGGRFGREEPREGVQDICPNAKEAVWGGRPSLPDLQLPRGKSRTD